MMTNSLRLEKILEYISRLPSQGRTVLIKVLIVLNTLELGRTLFSEFGRYSAGNSLVVACEMCLRNRGSGVRIPPAAPKKCQRSRRDRQESGLRSAYGYWRFRVGRYLAPRSLSRERRSGTALGCAGSRAARDGPAACGYCYGPRHRGIHQWLSRIAVGGAGPR